MDTLLAYILCTLGGATLGGVVVGLTMRHKRRTGPDAAKLRRQVMRGTYKILGDDYAGAIEELGAVIQSDPDSPDTYFVLGRLYRRSGQYARAVQVHQNLAIRHDEKKGDVKKYALFELAEDYRAAGFWERAADTYLELVEQTPQWREAVENLFQVALRGRLWRVAAEALPRLEKLGKPVDDELAAHLLAEYAQEQLSAKAVDAARRTLKTALKRNPHCPHVALVFARLHAANGKPKAVIQAVEEALGQRPDLAHLILDSLPALAQRHDFSERLDLFLESHLDTEATPHWAFRLLAARRLREQGENLKAREQALELMAQDIDIPSLRDFAHELAIALPSHWTPASNGWRCRRCAHTEPRLGWFCPSCLGWGTLDAPQVSPSTG